MGKKSEITKKMFCRGHPGHDGNCSGRMTAAGQATAGLPLYDQATESLTDKGKLLRCNKCKRTVLVRE